MQLFKTKEEIKSQERLNVDIDKLLDKWLEIEAPFKLDQLQEITTSLTK